MFERILIPVELGGEAPSTIAFAKSLAAANAKVRLVHVIVNETTLFYADLLEREEFTAEATKRFEELKSQFSADQFEIDAELRQGMTVHECVVEEIEKFEPDVVVMGSHGRRGLSRLLLGSDVQRVLRASTKPICVVKGPHAAADSDRGLERIAFATDFESTSNDATSAFRELVKRTGAAGHVLHVFESDPWFTMGNAVAVPGGGYSMPVIGKEVEERVQQRRSELEGQLADLAASWKAEGVDVHTKLLEGQPWEQIGDFIENEKIDLLVLGSHHYGTFDRIMLGSIAEKILRTANCPVLVAPTYQKPIE